MNTVLVGVMAYGYAMCLLLMGAVFAWEAPYVTSLLCAVGTYAVVGLLDGLQPPEPEVQRA